MPKRSKPILQFVPPATGYLAAFFAAATDSTVTISPITLPVTVALAPPSLSSSASCPSSV